MMHVTLPASSRSDTGRTTNPRAPVQESLATSDFSAYDTSDDNSGTSSRDSYSEGADSKALFEKHHCTRHGCKARRTF